MLKHVAKMLRVIKKCQNLDESDEPSVRHPTASIDKLILSCFKALESVGLFDVRHFEGGSHLPSGCCKEKKSLFVLEVRLDLASVFSPQMK